ALRLVKAGSLKTEILQAHLVGPWRAPSDDVLQINGVAKIAIGGAQTLRIAQPYLSKVGRCLSCRADIFGLTAHPMNGRPPADPAVSRSVDALVVCSNLELG